MTDPARTPQPRPPESKTQEDLDAESVVEGLRELFEPDNTQVPPPTPDALPPDDGPDSDE